MGQGIISVSKGLFEKQEPPKSMNGNFIDEGDPLKQPETLAEWHALLMLPEEYHLLEVKDEVIYPFWHVTVESDAIPVVEGKLPDVTPIYRSESMDDGTRKNYLERIELYPYTSERQVIWQRSEQ